MESESAAAGHPPAARRPVQSGHGLDSAAGPAAPSKASRLLAVDATRGLALLGMMAIHALWAYDADGNPTLSFSLAAGRSAATFAVLAGVGIALATGRSRVRWGSDGKGAAASLAARALAIGAIGLSLGYTDVGIAGVILAYYAVLFLLAIPLVFLPTRVLAATGVLIAVAVPVLSHLVRDDLPPIWGGNPSWGYLFEDPFGLLVELCLTGFYPALPWMAYLCAGLFVGRLGLSSATVALRLLFGGLAVALSASAMSWLALGPLGGRVALENAGADGQGAVSDTLVFGATGTLPTSTWWWLTVDAPHTTTPLDLFHTIGIAVALLGAMLLLFRHAPPALIAVLGPLAAAGSMTLTLYTAHIIFMNSPLDVFGASSGYLFQVVLALLFASAWRAAKGRGPLEEVVASAARPARRAVTSRSATGPAGGTAATSRCHAGSSGGATG